MTAGTPRTIRERVGKRGVPAYLERAAQRQIERDNLDELIADFDKVHGPADPQAMAAMGLPPTDWMTTVSTGRGHPPQRPVLR